MLAITLESPLYEMLNTKLSPLEEVLGRENQIPAKERKKRKKSSIESRNCIGQGAVTPLD
jgi:hypothetical protein